MAKVIPTVAVLSCVTLFPLSGWAKKPAAITASKAPVAAPAPEVPVAAPVAKTEVAPPAVAPATVSAEQTVRDSLTQLAKDIEIDEKISKIMDAKIITDDPDYARFFLHADGYMGLLGGTSTANFGVNVGANVRVNPDLWIDAGYTRSLKSWTPYSIEPAYDYDGANLPLATPEGKRASQSIELGATWLFSHNPEKIIQPQVYSVNTLYSQQIGNTRYTAINVNYSDVQVTVERNYGLRAGAILEQHSVDAECGNGGYLTANSPSYLYLKGEDGASRSVNGDTTAGWTNETNIMMYLGLSRIYKQGSIVELTHRKTGTKYTVTNFINTTFYCDAMISVNSQLDDVKYRGKSYSLQQGNADGQLPISDWGVRFGWSNLGGTAPYFPWSMELGYMPGSGSYFFKQTLGIGYWL
jgi:hypothetical protein